MNEEKELKSLINKPWFRRMRGGTQLRMEKEGMERLVARSMVEMIGTCSRMNDEKKETSKPGKVKEVRGHASAKG